jgi:hypothetical protein
VSIVRHSPPEALVLVQPPLLVKKLCEFASGGYADVAAPADAGNTSSAIVAAAATTVE